MKNLENYVNLNTVKYLLWNKIEQNRITQENRNLKENIFELERRLTRVINLNDRYEHLLMQITLEMNSLTG